MSNNGQVLEMNIKSLLSAKNDLYTIPVYQRNYAWGEGHIRQLIKDIIDSHEYNKGKKKKYYLGTLVVDKTIKNGQTVYETIDGQQRLTTLNILAIALKKSKAFKEVDMDWFESLNLDYSNRKKSADTLKGLFYNSIQSSKKTNQAILHAYDLVISILKDEIAESEISLEEFANYLFNYVTIIRVGVPEETDLNHYFEIMNNRGEQLEKHEVLKANLLELFTYIEDKNEKKKSRLLFHKIWEACSNMEKYVEYGFTVNERHEIFGDGENTHFAFSKFDELLEKIEVKETEKVTNEIEEDDDDIGDSLDLIIKNRHSGKQKQNKKDEKPDSFNSIINFSNFLLHVLRIQVGKEKYIPLDDKQLIPVFKQFYNNKTTEEKVEFAKTFGFNLLKTKYLFDKYIIKRNTSTHNEEWSLLKMRYYGKSENWNYIKTFNDDADDKLVQLLSMFHVSVPTLSYKHWLNGALKFVFENPSTTKDDYILYLEGLAKEFVFNRIIAKEPKEYYDMIFHSENNPIIKWGKIDSESSIDLSKFSFGNITNNLLFNYVDYLLWKEEISKEKPNPKIKDFNFTSRSSVEHFYPQNPKDGFPRLKEENVLHSFGNLCLISHRKNSSLSNFSPLSKTEFYLKGKVDSIKQYMMMTQYEPKEWGEDSILHHGNFMIETLRKAIL